MREVEAGQANTGNTAPDDGHGLPATLLSWLEGPPGEVVAVIATVDEDGAPRTAVLGAVRAVSLHELRFVCRRSRATLANIERDGRVSLLLAGAPDLAVSVTGRARTLGPAQALPDTTVVGVAVEWVTDTLQPGLEMLSGIRYAIPDEVRVRLEALNAELASLSPHPE